MHTMYTYANIHTYLPIIDAEADKYRQTDSHKLSSNLHLSPVYTYTPTHTNIHTPKIKQ